MLTMLARWVMSGDADEGTVAADALESGGHKNAADYVRWWMDMKTDRKSRDQLFRRIRSELRGKIVSEGLLRKHTFRNDREMIFHGRRLGGQRLPPIRPRGES
jgi:hypothetical protein